MSVILKENNIVYMCNKYRKRYDKLLGSSKYRFVGNDTLIRTRKSLKPVPIQLAFETEPSEASFDAPLTELAPLSEFWQNVRDDYRANHPEYIPDDSYMQQLRALHDKIAPVEVIPEYKVIRAKKTSYKLNKKKVREKISAFFGLRQSRHFLAFYTVTYPCGFPDDLAYKTMNTVFTRLRKTSGFRSYLWVAERQDNGTIHFHFLTNNHMAVRKVNYYMGKAIENQIIKEKLNLKYTYTDKKTGNKYESDKFEISKYHGVDVRHVNNNKKALNAYLTKYVSKNDITFYRLPYHCSRDISELFTGEVFKDMYDPDFAFILQNLKYVETFISDNEFCTMEYFNQKQPNGKYFQPPESWYKFKNYANQIIYDNHKTPFTTLPLYGISN